MPLSLYINSCHDNDTGCNNSKAYPSDFGSLFSQMDSTTSTMSAFITKDPTRPRNGFCDASVNNCKYFIGVIAESKVAESFTILVSKSNDMEILPKPSTSDELITLDPRSVSNTQGKTFEVFVDKGKTVALTMEPCSGTPSMFVCDDTCKSLKPSVEDYRWFSDRNRRCEKLVGESKPRCSVNQMQNGYVEIASAQRSNYLVGVSGDGSFVLSVNTGNSTRTLLPQTTSNIDVVRQNANSVVIRWNPAVFLDYYGEFDAPVGLTYM